jgi:hypothetical protein
VATVSRGRIPLWVKLAYTVWTAVWATVYWIHNGPDNFLWLCDVANVLVGVAIWWESPLVASSQAVGVLLVQLVWAVDYVGALLAGRHPVGGTEYMFDAAQPLWLRGLSLFHLFVPPLLLWLVWRLGYDRRGWLLQTAVTWLLLPATYLLAAPGTNINWVWKPFGKEQHLLPPLGYLAALMLLYPLLLYLPTHLVLRQWARRRAGQGWS